MNPAQSFDILHSPFRYLALTEFRFAEFRFDGIHRSPVCRIFLNFGLQNFDFAEFRFADFYLTHRVLAEFRYTRGVWIASAEFGFPRLTEFAELELKQNLSLQSCGSHYYGLPAWGSGVAQKLRKLLKGLANYLSVS